MKYIHNPIVAHSMNAFLLMEGVEISKNCGKGEIKILLYGGEEGRGLIHVGGLSCECGLNTAFHQ